MTAIEDFRRDAASLVAYKQLLDHRPGVDEDPAEDDDIHLLRDFSDENRWTGFFSAENDAEKVYEVSYNYSAQKFYLTEYVMRECISMDPKEILYAE